MPAPTAHASRRTSPDALARRQPRVSRAPRTAPPFDDEGHPRALPGQAVLDLHLPGTGCLPEVPPGPEDLPRTVRAEIEDFCARRPTPAADLPNARLWTIRFVQGLLEVMTGARPPQQLSRMCDEAVYAQVVARADAASRLPKQRARAARQATRGSSPIRRPAPFVRTVVLCEPRDGVAEASVVIQSGSRCKAVSVRLEGLDGRWRATNLRVL